jgi:hypothetical protein
MVSISTVLLISTPLPSQKGDSQLAIQPAG